MKTFCDSQGRTWALSITIDAIKRVQGLCNVNLAKLMDGEPPLLTRLEADIELLCNVIYALVKPAADLQQITDEQFGAALGGEAIIAAHDAFWSELADFFRSLRRSELVKAIRVQHAMVEAAVKAADARIEAIDVEALVRSTLGNSAGNSPASSASIPDH